MVETIFVYGCLNGLQIAVLSLAFTIVYLPTGVFFIALAAIFTLVPYMAWHLSSGGAPLVAIIALPVVTGIAAALALKTILHESLIRREAPSSSHIVVSLGAYLVITELVVVCWQSESKQLSLVTGQVLDVVGLRVSSSLLTAGAICGLLLGIAYLFLYLTPLGLALRATSENARQAELNGIDVRKLRVLVFGASGFLAAGVALASGVDKGFGPYSGMAAFLPAVAATIVGGRWSLWGPVVGGFTVGLVRAAASWALSPAWEEAATFFLLMSAVMIRPAGVLRSATRVEYEQ